MKTKKAGEIISGHFVGAIIPSVNEEFQRMLLPFIFSNFIWDFGKLPFPTHLGKYFIKIGKIRAKIHEIGKIKAIF